MVQCVLLIATNECHILCRNFSMLPETSAVLVILTTSYIMLVPATEVLTQDLNIDASTLPVVILGMIKNIVLDFNESNILKVQISTIILYTIKPITITLLMSKQCSVFLLI